MLEINVGFVSAVYALLGSIYLAKALLFVSDEAVYTQSKVPFGFNFEMLRNLCEQRFDTRLGLFFLFFATATQIVGYLVIEQLPIWAVAVLSIPVLFFTIRRERNTRFRSAVDAGVVMIVNKDDPSGLRESAFKEMPQSEWDHAMKKAAEYATKSPLYRAFL